MKFTHLSYIENFIIIQMYYIDFNIKRKDIGKKIC